MKLLSRKTKKAIEKSVRKALKKAGPALVAAVVSSLGSSLAALASTESAERPGKSNLTDVVDRARKAVKGGDKKARSRKSRRESQPERSTDTEDTRFRPNGEDAEPLLT